MQGPEPQSIASRKQALRSSLRAQRAALAPPPGSPAAVLYSQAVADHVDAELRTAGVRSVALYAAHRDELDPRPLAERARRRGCLVSYPRVSERTPPRLSFHLCSEAELTPGYAGLPEPSAAAPPSPPLDAILVPGLGFDRRGGRLGYGKGFYDAALREQPAALRIAVGYDFQLVPTIPSGEQDEPVDLVITPTGRWRTGARPLPAPPARKESL